MKQLVRSVILLALSAFCGHVAFGQEEWEEGGEIQSVEIEIVKERQITLPRADRNFEKIPPRPVDPLKPAMTYEFKSPAFTGSEFKLDVRPLRVKQEELSKLYSGYLSAGFGSYNSPYLEGSLTSKRDAKLFYGGTVYHRSFGKGPVNDELSASGDTRANVFVKGMGAKITTQAAFRYDNRFNHFYASTGAPIETRLPADILHAYHVGALEASLENTKPGPVDFKLGGNFSYLADNYSAVESKLGLSFDGDYKLKNERFMTLKTNYKLIARKDEAAEARPRHLFNLAPSYRLMIAEKATLSVGLNTVIENDTISSGSFHLYPDVWLGYPAAKNIEAYVGLTGGYDEVSLHKLSAENPWIAPNVPLSHTNRALDFIVGAKGRIGRQVSFDAGASVVRFRDLYFYDNLVTDRTKFTTIYDDATRLGFFAQTGFNVGEKAQLNVRGDYFSYATDNIAYPWHRPSYKLGAYSSWMIAGKLMTDVNFITQGGARAFDHVTGGIVKLQPAIDVNLKLRYFWSKRFSIFADGSNLLNRSYPVYLNYQVRGIQVTAGASYCF